MFKLVFIAVVLFNLGVFWSAVKMDYRDFLSGGKEAQIVTVSKTEALQKLSDLVSNVTVEDYKDGIETMIKRFFFLEYFSATIKNIPTNNNYTDGKYCIGALKHVFMPRLFFPNKESISDSEQSRELTGIKEISGTESGVSISTGYMAATYADYGPIGMLIPIFIIGFILGKIYKYFVNKIENPLWSYGFILPMYFLFNIFGFNITKIAGNTFMFLIVFFLILKFVLPRLDLYLRNE